MHEALEKQKKDTKKELKRFAKEKKTREENIKPINLDFEDRKVAGRGFVSLQ